MADRIEIKGIRAKGWHGVLEFERIEGQEFIVDIAFDVDAAAAAIKTAIEAGQNAAETLKKVVKQAADTAETNLKTATAQAEASVKAAMSKAKVKA